MAAEENMEGTGKPDDSGGSNQPGAGEEHRSRYEERIQRILEKSQQQNADLVSSMAQMREEMAYLKGRAAQQTEEKKRDWTDIEDPDERRDAMLAQTHGEMLTLKQEIARRDAEAAQQKVVERALRGLDFGQDDDAEDAKEAVDAYSRKGKRPDEVRAFAERLARKFSPAKSNDNKETKADPKPTEAEAKAKQEQDWAKEKLKDAQKTRAVPQGQQVRPAEIKTRPNVRPGLSSKDKFREARMSLKADLTAAGDAE